MLHLLDARRQKRDEQIKDRMGNIALDKWKPGIEVTVLGGARQSAAPRGSMTGGGARLRGISLERISVCC